MTDKSTSQVPGVSDAELAALERLERAATPAPWISWNVEDGGLGGSGFLQPQGETDPDVYVMVSSEGDWHPAAKADQDFIAAARNAIPGLITELQLVGSAGGAEFDERDQVLSLTGPGYYLQVSISPDDLVLLRGLTSASWDERTTIRAGVALGSPVFWSCHVDEPSAVGVLVGPDDETWVLSLAIPVAAIRRLLEQLGA